MENEFVCSEPLSNKYLARYKSLKLFNLGLPKDLFISKFP